jgi:hypothetical protein
MPKTPKRPRDLNQWEKRMVDLATMDEAEREAARKAAGATAKKAKGGKTRATRQTPGNRGSD